MRLGDIDGLETEDVYVQSSYAAKQNMRQNGATEEEIEFLLEYRVELNAFASDELVAWIEGKLEEHSISKVIPDEKTLAHAYRRFRTQARVQTKIDEVLEGEAEEDHEAKVPDDLQEQISERLQGHPATTWDQAVLNLVEAEEVDDG
jgi:hypothetical protein